MIALAEKCNATVDFLLMNVKCFKSMLARYEQILFSGVMFWIAMDCVLSR